MSSFTLQKSFEKSLRSTGTYQVPIITPLKTEIHKGCTGKAHACGSIKSANTMLANKPSTTPKPKVKCDGKTLRKNSLSSETVSDSGSEISSWNSNKDSSPSSSVAPPLLPKPLKRTKSVNCASTNDSMATVRRRTSDSVISTDIPDNVRNNIKRGRLLSDGGEDKKAIEEASRLRRSSSFRLKNVPPMVPIKPKIAQPPPTPIKRNGSFNNRLRNSFRNKTPIANWNTLWETSFASRMGGGSLRLLDKKLLATCDKVNKAIYCLTSLRLMGSTRVRRRTLFVSPSRRNAEVCLISRIHHRAWFRSTTQADR